MTTEEMDEVASHLAGRYKRRCWWASYEDLKQEALVTILAAHENYLKHPEGDERGYVWKSAAYQLRNMLLRASAPVSASGHKLDELRGLVRASLEDLAKAGISVVSTGSDAEMVLKRPAAQHEAQLADEVLYDLDWLRRVRNRLIKVLAPVENSVAAREVLLGYLPPHEVAEEAGLNVRLVYRAAKRARRAIGCDGELYRLVQERVKE